MSLQALLHVTRFEPLPIVVAENPGEAVRLELETDRELVGLGLRPGPSLTGRI
jgi:hypothetical protein